MKNVGLNAHFVRGYTAVSKQLIFVSLARVNIDNFAFIADKRKLNDAAAEDGRICGNLRSEVISNQQLQTVYQ